MADEQLRALERRWRESALTADAADWLRERLRTGGLDEVRLRWAAGCGDEPATLVLGPGPWPGPVELAGELAGHPDVEARFWLAVVRAGWSQLGDDRFLAKLWFDERQLLGLRAPGYSTIDYATRASDLLLSVRDLQRRALARCRGVSEDAPLPPYMRRSPREALEAMQRGAGALLLREALRHQLRADWTPWLLGLADPVAARVEANPAPPQVRGVTFEQPGDPT
jgi:hypothetical protein